MNDLRTIADLYAEVDDFLEALRDKAIADGATTHRERIEHKQRLSGLSFENRLTLVLEKGSENWKKVLQHYSVRNQIAHGRLRSQRIDVSRVIEEFHQIATSLARN